MFDCKISCVSNITFFFFLNLKRHYLNFIDKLIFFYKIYKREDKIVKARESYDSTQPSRSARAHEQPREYKTRFKYI
jgi:hypothetical protein